MITISINAGGLWFLFGIFFFGCLTFSVHSMLKAGRIQALATNFRTGQWSPSDSP